MKIALKCTTLLGYRIRYNQILILGGEDASANLKVYSNLQVNQNMIGMHMIVKHTLALKIKSNKQPLNTELLVLLYKGVHGIYHRESESVAIATI